MNIRLAVMASVALASVCSMVDAQQTKSGDRQRQAGAAQQQLITRWLMQDKDDDGKISKEEATGAIKNNFDRIDSNNDGSLDRSELTALARRVAANPRNNQQRNNRNRGTMTSEALVRRAPEGVKVLPDISYREGNPAWKLDLAMPSDRGATPRPAIVFVHGGGWRNGDKRTAGFINPALEFAAKGYVCISINYRLLDGETTIANCVEDTKCAVRWLRAHAKEYNVDPERIGAYGNSAGAHLVAMLGMCPKSAGLEGDGPYQEYSSTVQAVVASATPASFLIPMSERARRAEQQGGQQRSSRSGLSEEVRKKISPITHVSAEAPPILLVHEASDAVVGVFQSDKLVEALKKAGAKDVTYMRLEDGSGHGTFQRNIAKTGPAREAFFARVLKE